MIENFSLSLHPNNKSEKYARRKSAKNSTGRAEKDQQVAIRRTGSKSFHRLQMVYQFVTARYRDIGKNIKTLRCWFRRIVQQEIHGISIKPSRLEHYAFDGTTENHRDVYVAERYAEVGGNNEM